MPPSSCGRRRSSSALRVVRRVSRDSQDDDGAWGQFPSKDDEEPRAHPPAGSCRYVSASIDGRCRARSLLLERHCVLPPVCIHRLSSPDLKPPIRFTRTCHTPALLLTAAHRARARKAASCRVEIAVHPTSGKSKRNYAARQTCAPKITYSAAHSCAAAAYLIAYAKRRMTSHNSAQIEEVRGADRAPK